jgi:hypothetical protein
MIKMSFLLLTLCAAASQAESPDIKAEPLLHLSLALTQDMSQASIASLKIERIYLGSGSQDVAGTENADPVADYGVWHVPQYMPGFPTAATIWPRVVDVRCAEDNTCAGYLITPAMGRGEYLFFKPIKK